MSREFSVDESQTLHGLLSYHGFGVYGLVVEQPIDSRSCILVVSRSGARGVKEILPTSEQESFSKGCTPFGWPNATHRLYVTTTLRPPRICKVLGRFVCSGARPKICLFGLLRSKGLYSLLRVNNEKNYSLRRTSCELKANADCRRHKAHFASCLAG